VILYALIFGLDAAKKAFPPSWVRIGMTLGVLLYGGTGVVTWILGGDFLSYGVLAENFSRRDQRDACYFLCFWLSSARTG